MRSGSLRANIEISTNDKVGGSPDVVARRCWPECVSGTLRPRPRGRVMAKEDVLAFWEKVGEDEALSSKLESDVEPRSG